MFNSLSWYMAALFSKLEYICTISRWASDINNNNITLLYILKLVAIYHLDVLNEYTHNDINDNDNIIPSSL